MANTDQNPFVGPRPIQQGEPLYGRSTEVRALYNRLAAHRIVVLHSPSGAGKSSLVQAGLIPRLKAGGFEVWKPIRVNLDIVGLDGVAPGTNRYLLSAMLSLEEELPAERRRSPALLASLDFRAYLETRPRRKGREDRPVVLLFDQFEEVLTVAPRAVHAKRALFASLGEALDTGKFWALFVIRDDHLAAFAPYRELLPTHMSNSFRLDLLGLAGAREVAEQLAHKGGRTFPAVDHLVRDLSMVQVQQPDGSFVAEQGLYVEPVQLQVVCRRLWDAMPADDRSIEEEDIADYADVTRALGGYYSQAVARIAGGDPAVERTLRDWVGNRLIVGGIRSQVRRETGYSAGLSNALIDQLLGCYLVHTEQRAGADWFELAHDRLVVPVQQDNGDWEQAHLHPLQVQARLWEEGRRSQSMLLSAEALASATIWAEHNPALVTAGEQEFLELSRRLRAEAARQRRRQRIYMAGLAAGMIITAGLGTLAWQLRNVAQGQRADAEAASLRAREAAWMGYVGTFADKDPTRALVGLGELPSPDRVPGWLQAAHHALQRPVALAVLKGHRGSVLNASLSPDGTRVVTAAYDGTARVWNADGTGAPVVLEGHAGPVRSASFSADGTRIVTASADGTARVWNADGSGTSVELKAPAEQGDRQLAGGLVSASLSRDAKKVLTRSEDGQVSVWSADGRGAPMALQRPAGHGMVSASFSPDGTRVVTTEADGAPVWVHNADGSGEPVGLDVLSEAASGAHVVVVTLHGPVRVRGAHEQGGVELMNSEGMVEAWFGDDLRVIAVDRDRRHWQWQKDWRGERRPALADRDGDGVPDPLDAGIASPFRPNPGWTGFSHRETGLSGTVDPPYSASFSEDGRRVLTVQRGHARLWNADRSGDFVHVDGSSVRSASLSADGERIVTLSDDMKSGYQVQAWNASTGRRTTDIDGQPVLTASADRDAGRVAQVWRSEKAPAQLRGHDDVVNSAVLGADGKRAVTASSDGTARVWDLARTAFAGQVLQHAEPVKWVSLSADGKLVGTVDSKHAVRVWNAELARTTLAYAPSIMPAPMDTDERWVQTASLSPDGKRMATGYHGTGDPKVWELVDGRAPERAEASSGEIGCAGVLWASFSPDGKRLVASSADPCDPSEASQPLRVWDMGPSGDATRPEPIVLTGHRGVVLAASFSPDGERLVTGSQDRSARVWQLDGSGGSVELVGHAAAIRSVAFSPDGTRVLTASDDKTARLWSVDGTSFVALTGHQDPVYLAAFSPDGKTLLTASEDGTAGLWRADGAGERVATLGALKEPVYWAAFSPDSEFVVTASGSSNEVRIWRSDGSGGPAALTGHEGAVNWAAFSPNGKQVVTASDDKTVRLWTTDRAQLRALMRAATSLCIAAEDRVQYLGDAPAEACEAFAACERDHGRPAGGASAGLGWSVCRAP